MSSWPDQWSWRMWTERRMWEDGLRPLGGQKSWVRAHPPSSYAFNLQLCLRTFATALRHNTQCFSTNSWHLWSLFGMTLTKYVHNGVYKLQSELEMKFTNTDLICCTFKSYIKKVSKNFYLADFTLLLYRLFYHADYTTYLSINFLLSYNFQ